MEASDRLLQHNRLLHCQLQVVEVGLLPTIPDQCISWSHRDGGLLLARKRIFSEWINTKKTLFIDLPQLRIPNLTMNEIYEVKVQAASLSIFNPTKLQIGESMPPKTVSNSRILTSTFDDYSLASGFDSRFRSICSPTANTSKPHSTRDSSHTTTTASKSFWPSSWAVSV